MDYKTIHQLLDKYWEGETSLDEEKTLKAYFNGGEVATDLQQFTPLFQYLNLSEEPALSEHFDQELMSKLEGKRIALRNPRIIHWIMRAAAIVLIIGTAFYLQKQTPLATPAKKAAINWEEKETISPEEAWAQTKAALELVSRKLNKGSKEASKGMAKVGVATKIIKN